VTKVERGRKEVILGLGPERFVIAFLTRKGLLLSFIFPIWRVVPSVIKRSIRLFF
jgi:hypothetical protein